MGRSLARIRSHILRLVPIYQPTATHQPTVTHHLTCALQMFRLLRRQVILHHHILLQANLPNLLEEFLRRIHLQRLHMVTHSRLAQERQLPFLEASLRRPMPSHDLGLHPLSQVIRNRVQGQRRPCRVACHYLLR